LREIVPLADTTIYDMEQRGDFPQRFYLTCRCVVWDLAGAKAWVEMRREAPKAKAINRAPARIWRGLVAQAVERAAGIR
jgi:prophage regulatory protein